MGTKTKTVGGGQATGTANAFNNWMLNGLQTGNFGSSPSGVDQAAGQTNNFGNAVNSMLSGNGNQNNYKLLVSSNNLVHLSDDSDLISYL